MSPSILRFTDSYIIIKLLNYLLLYIGYIQYLERMVKTMITKCLKSTVHMQRRLVRWRQDFSLYVDTIICFVSPFSKGD